MARSVTEIETQITTIAQNDEYLAPKLTSTSNVSMWRLWVRVIAVCFNALEQLWDTVKADINKLLAAKVYFNDELLRAKILEFQLGDTVKVIDGVVGYEVIDVSKRIVSYCSIENNIDTGIATAKVAKKDSNGLPLQLSNSELNQVKLYVSKISPPGCTIQIVSRPKDKLVNVLTVYYDGLRNAEELKAQVVLAIKNYYKNLDFNGIISESKLEDSVQVIPGVINPVFTYIAYSKWNESLNVYDSLISFSTIPSKSYQTFAGYAAIDEDSPLEDNITMVAV